MEVDLMPPPQRRSRERRSTTHQLNSSAQSPSSTSTPDSFLKPTNHTLETLPDNTILVHATNCLGEWGAGVAKAIAEIWPVANDVYAAHCKDAAKGQLEGTCLLIPPQQEDSNSSNTSKKTSKIWIACLFTSYGYGRPTKKKAGKDSKAKIVEYTAQALQNFRTQLDGFQEQSIDQPVEEVPAEVDRDAGDRSNLEEKSRKRKRIDEDDEQERKRKGKDEGSSLKPKAQDLVGTRDGLNADTTKSPSMIIYSPRFNSGSFGVPWDQTSSAINDVFKSWNGEWFVLSPL